MRLLHKKFLKYRSYLFYFPKGLLIKIREGNKVNTEIIASNIAIPVNTPKYIVGINFEKTRIENPNTIVIDVLSIATPTVE